MLHPPRPWPRRAAAFALALTSLGCLPKAPSSPERPSAAPVAPRPRLDDAARSRLRAALTAQLEANEVPAAAFALVLGDEVVAIETFGTTTLDGDRPVDADTLFALGSTTKTFTAALAAIAVDRGVARWDDPVGDHLSWFDPAPAGAPAGARLTLEDMFSHRTGFSGMDLLWLAGEIDRASMLRVAAGAEASAPYRSGFVYNNVMFAAAGDAIAAALGGSWEALVARELFAPLEMRRTTLSAAETAVDPNHAAGTFRDPQRGTTAPIPMRELAAICPAGCIHSSARDMGNYLRFVLARGGYDGRALLRPEIFEALWSPRVQVGPRAYGVGWFIGELPGPASTPSEGRRLLQHGGNIDGYQSDLRVLPDLQIAGFDRPGVAYVLLTNATVHGLRRDLDHVVLSALDPERFAAPTPTKSPPADASAAPRPVPAALSEARIEPSRLSATDRRRFARVVDFAARARAQRRLGALEWSGAARLANAGITGQVRTVFDADQMRDETDYGRFGRSVGVTTRSWSWGDSSFTEPDFAEGVYLTQAWLDHPYATVGDLRGFYSRLELVAVVEVDGRERFEVRALTADAPPERLWFDAETGDLVRREYSLVQKAMGTIPVVVEYADYASHAGLRWPRRLIARDPQRGTSTAERELPRPVEVDAQTFSREPQAI